MLLRLYIFEQCCVKARSFIFAISSITISKENNRSIGQNQSAHVNKT